MKIFPIVSLALRDDVIAGALSELGIRVCASCRNMIKAGSSGCCTTGQDYGMPVMSKLVRYTPSYANERTNLKFNKS